MNEFFEKTLILHKKYVATAFNKKDKNLILLIDKTAKELALVSAKFKCEACGSKEKLQFHHLIMRFVKKFTNEWRYLSQRHYWANCIILCEDCHDKIHFRNKTPENNGYISESKIKKIMKKYRVEEK